MLREEESRVAERNHGSNWIISQIESRTIFPRSRRQQLGLFAEIGERDTASW